MHFDILTLFPEFFTSPLSASILEKARKKNVFSWDAINIRDFSENKNGNKNIDDKVYGGGAGMLIQPEPVFRAIENAKKNVGNANLRSLPENSSSPEVIYFSPSGEKLTQDLVENFAHNNTNKILLCGHYEGIDERVLATAVDHHICVGDAVLTGGEIPALYFMDAVIRLLPEGIAKKQSHEEESFSEKFFGKGEYPQFTRPEVWNDMRVPNVLLSGDDKKIEDWKFASLKNCDEQEANIIRLRREKFSGKKPYKARNSGYDFLLRVPEKNDITLWYEWFNDPEVCKFLRLENCSWQDEVDYYNFQHYNLSLLVLAIIDKKSKKNIGNISLEIVAEQPHIAQLGLVLGDKNFWQKGVGTAVTREAVQIAFADLGVEKIQLDVFTQNIAAQKVYEKCGFTKIGISRKFYEKNGKFFDVFLYELVKDEKNVKDLKGGE
jgi:tRNA (guanine37-N1)-methyltransferase